MTLAVIVLCRCQNKKTANARESEDAEELSGEVEAKGTGWLLDGGAHVLLTVRRDGALRLRMCQTGLTWAALPRLLVQAALNRRSSIVPNPRLYAYSCEFRKGGEQQSYQRCGSKGGTCA